MDLNWLLVLAAFGGGMFGAAVGAVPAFVLAGAAAIGTFSYSVLTGNSPDLGVGSLADLGPFGPWLSPNIAFAGGVAAAAYAARRGIHASGNDTVTSLTGLGRPDVLFVGGAFGAFGYLVQWACATFSPSIGDNIVLTPVVTAIVVSNIASRLTFGRSGLFGRPENGSSRWQPTESRNWIPWQERPFQVVTVGIALALPVAYLISVEPSFGFDLPLGISALWLLFLCLGFKTPVAHHITLGATIGVLVLGDFGWGVVWGISAAIIGEIAAGAFQYHGDTAIDPPSVALLVVWLGAVALAPTLDGITGFVAVLLGAALLAILFAILLLLKRGTAALPTADEPNTTELIAA